MISSRTDFEQTGKTLSELCEEHRRLVEIVEMTNKQGSYASVSVHYTGASRLERGVHVDSGYLMKGLDIIIREYVHRINELRKELAEYEYN